MIRDGHDETGQQGILQYWTEYSSAWLRLYQFYARVSGGLCCLKSWSYLWDSLVSKCPLEVVLWSGDRHEGLQHVLVENTLWVLHRLVAHEAVDESERSLRDQDAAERQVCEVGVLCDGLCVSLTTELAENLQVVVCRAGV